MSDELTGLVTVAPGHRRRYRIGHDSGDVFTEGEDYDGVTLTIEVTSPEDGEFVLGALSHGQNMPPATRDVLVERWRQWFYEGWSDAHDDAHGSGELAQAAGLYAFCAHSDDTNAYAVGLSRRNMCPPGWPFAPEWWKPSTRRRDLVKAGALIIAEIERLDRTTGRRWENE